MAPLPNLASGRVVVASTGLIPQPLWIRFRGLNQASTLHVVAGAVKEYFEKMLKLHAFEADTGDLPYRLGDAVMY